MFLMLQRLMEIMNDLELSHRLIVSNNTSIPGDKPDEPQNYILYDGLLPQL
jgi:hypothetical protein